MAKMLLPFRFPDVLSDQEWRGDSGVQVVVEPQAVLRLGETLFGCQVFRHVEANLEIESQVKMIPRIRNYYYNILINNFMLK